MTIFKIFKIIWITVAVGMLGGLTALWLVEDKIGDLVRKAAGIGYLISKNEWLDYLFHCPICISVWLTVGFSLLCHYYLLKDWAYLVPNMVISVGIARLLVKIGGFDEEA